MALHDPRLADPTLLCLAAKVALAKRQLLAETEPQLRYFVVYDDEPLPPDLRVTDLVVCLARKAETEAEWLEQVRALGFGPGAREEGKSGA